MGRQEKPQHFEGLDTLDLKVIDHGKVVTLSGHARGHKLYLKRVEVNPKAEEELDQFEYEAQVDGYEPLGGHTARDLFEKYYRLTKYKSRL